MKYVTIFHANLNYAYLTEDRYEFVIRNSYELILDVMREEFSGTKFVFEASGFTVEQIAEKCPDVLEKLKGAVENGTCEFMGSPYAHPMLPNFPQVDGEWSIKFSNEVYERHLGIVPKSFWNPECGWRDYVPQQVVNCGYEKMIGDFEAYSRSCDSEGKPLRPEIYEKEHEESPGFYNFGFKYDLEGDERAIHFPFNKVAGLGEDELKIFLRSDRIAQFGVRYFMGMDGYSFEDYLDLIKKYSAQKEEESEGALIIFADDAEYVGTNGWFRLKYQNKPDNVFEATPGSQEKLIKLVSEVKRLGEFCRFDEACSLEPMKEEITFDDDSAWHGGRASTWAGTPMAKLLRPWQDLVREKLHKTEVEMSEEDLKRAWYYLTNSYNSDGQWPPTLPDAPHIIHPYNYEYCFENLMSAELMVGGVDRSKLETSAKETLETILGIQQERILEKAENLIESGSKEEKKDAELAKGLIERSKVLTSVEGSSLLYPSEYKIRADMLVEGRRLVGGVVLEKIEE